MGKKSIPIVPYKFTTAIEIATSSLFFETDGAKAAIADEPQIAVPKPTNQPIDPGQLNFFAKLNVRSSTTNKTDAMATKLPIPILEMWE
jgi:hypothetical protein